MTRRADAAPYPDPEELDLPAESQAWECEVLAPEAWAAGVLAAQVIELDDFRQDLGEPLLEPEVFEPLFEPGVFAAENWEPDALESEVLESDALESEVLESAVLHSEVLESEPETLAPQVHSVGRHRRPAKRKRRILKVFAAFGMVAVTVAMVAAAVGIGLGTLKILG